MRRNLAKAVKNKCVDCIYDSLAEGNKMQQISSCTVFACPLWGVRPTVRSEWPIKLVDKLSITLNVSPERVMAWNHTPYINPTV